MTGREVLTRLTMIKPPVDSNSEPDKARLHMQKCQHEVKIAYDKRNSVTSHKFKIGHKVHIQQDNPSHKLSSRYSKPVTIIEIQHNIVKVLDGK